MDLEEADGPTALTVSRQQPFPSGQWFEAPGDEPIEGGPELYDCPDPYRPRGRTLADINVLRALAKGQSHAEPRTWPPFRAQRHSFTPSNGQLLPSRIGTTPISPKTIALLPLTGMTLLELFGGMCAGLEAALRQGIPVRRYIYCDTSPVAWEAAAFRVEALSARYPALFPRSAYRDAFRSLPMDVFEVTLPHLLGAEDDNQWMVVAGWSCQDLSPAGAGRGLAGRHAAPRQ
jgi:hypothetical protein